MSKKKDGSECLSGGSRPHGLHRFFVGAEELQNDEVILRWQRAHQIYNVLRLRAGDHIIVLDNHGAEFDVALTAAGSSEVKGQVLEKRAATGEPKLQLTLYQSLLSRDKFELVLQKCTEVGVSRFVPVITRRSIVQNVDGVKPSKLIRWQRIIAEAAEQSRRGRIPELTEPLMLEKATDQLADFDCRLIASAEAEGVGLGSCLRACDLGGGARIALLIGPEGGFTGAEIERFAASGGSVFSLGRRILRTETAAVVASSIILYELGEMGK